MPRLVLGPLLRYVGSTQATVWVETDAACEVEVLGSRSRTFCVEGHHFGLVVVDGLEPGSSTEYGVALDGESVWPEPESASGFPSSVIRTPGEGRPVSLAFGSCRVALPHTPPYTLTPDQDERGKECDALRALAHRMLRQTQDEWPDRLLMLGDQVYVDEGSPEARRRIRERRDVSVAPHEEVADFEEFTWLYHEAWGDPLLRWLLSTVATAMVWDDHDMHDDWNISESWVRDMREQPWWQARVEGGVMSYWVYQHLGNLSPAELAENDLLREVREAVGDVGPMLREFADKADRENEGTRWSFCRDAADVRVVVIDSRAGRVLGDARHHHHHERAMLDDHEFGWLEQHVRGDCEHLVVGTSLPWLMLPSLHHLEAWNEAVCDGAWGSLMSRAGEKARRAQDLEHWPAFQDSFVRLADLLQEVAAGRRGEAPASITVVSGDVHHAYLAEVAFPRRAGTRSAVHQAVCSPFRNDLDRTERRVLRFARTRPALALARALSRAAGVGDPPVRWRLRTGPWFDNQVATLFFEGPEATFRLDKTVPGDQDADLECVFEQRLTR